MDEFIEGQMRLLQQLKGSEEALERIYPQLLQELATCTNRTLEDVEFALYHTRQQLRLDKHYLMEQVLMFHQTLDHQAKLKGKGL